MSENIETLKAQVEKLAAQGDSEAVELLKVMAKQLEAKENQLSKLTVTTSVKMEADLHVALKVHASQVGIRLQKVYEESITRLATSRDKYRARMSKAKEAGKPPKPGTRFSYEPCPNVGKSFTLNVGAEFMDTARDIAGHDQRRLCDVLYTGLVQYAVEEFGFVWEEK